MSGCPVEVLTADATALPLPDDRYSAAACFTMLHHIPTRDLQDRALAEIARVRWRRGSRRRSRRTTTSRWVCSGDCRPIQLAPARPAVGPAGT